MYELNIYVNNSKFISIVDNINVLQLLRILETFYTAENCSKLTVYNSISSVICWIHIESDVVRCYATRK